MGVERRSNRSCKHLLSGASMKMMMMMMIMMMMMMMMVVMHQFVKCWLLGCWLHSSGDARHGTAMSDSRLQRPRTRQHEQKLAPKVFRTSLLRHFSVGVSLALCPSWRSSCCSVVNAPDVYHAANLRSSHQRVSSVAWGRTSGVKYS